MTMATEAPRLSAGARRALSAFRKGFYFDRAPIFRALDEASRVAMMRGGAYVRKVAQRSMRYRKKASPPGQPPSAHSDGRGPLLRKMLDFAYDPQTKSVVVGPVALGRSSAPKLHEKGGRLQVVRRRTYKVGDGAPIRVLAEGVWSLGPTTKLAAHDPLGRLVVYTKLRSQRQVDRVHRLEDELYKPLDRLARKYPPRPFMVPALTSSQSKIAEFYRNAV